MSAVNGEPAEHIINRMGHKCGMTHWCYLVKKAQELEAENAKLKSDNHELREILASLNVRVGQQGPYILRANGLGEG